MTVQSPATEPSAPRNWLNLAAWPALFVLLAWLAASEHWLRPVRDVINVSRWVNGDVTLQQIAVRLVGNWAYDVVAFVAIGACTCVALNPRLARGRSLSGWGLVFLAGLILAGVVRGVQLGRCPAVGNLMSPLLAFLFGAVLGRALVGGQRTWVRRLTPLGVVILSVGGLTVSAARLAIAGDPLPGGSPRDSTISKSELADTLRGVRGGEQQGRRVRLLEQDLNSLIAVAASRLAPATQGRVALNRGSIAAEISVRLPGGTRRFANLRIRGTAQIDNGRLDLRGEQLSIGALSVPRLLVWLLSGPLGSALSHDPDLRTMIGSVDSLRIESGEAEIIFKPGECSDTFIPALALAVTGRTSIAAETLAQVRHLVENAGSLPAGDGRFVELLRRAFSLAQQRSVDGDPVEENRAALLAIAILLGDPRVETIVGPVFDEPLRDLAQRDLADTTLRGRFDWTKHFALSAGMVALSCEGISDRVGVLKELRDATGGSGFSFGDLAANRAGIRLAQLATFNANSARRMQEHLAGSVNLDDLFPVVTDLPEDLPIAEFQARFGDVNDVRYQSMIAEIERRLDECRLLQP